MLTVKRSSEVTADDQREADARHGRSGARVDWTPSRTSCWLSRPLSPGRCGPGPPASTETPRHEDPAQWDGGVPQGAGGDLHGGGAGRQSVPGRGAGALVSFEPGARTHWHSHPLGQTLIVTAGVGWTQCEGDPKVEIRAGDVIWCPCQRRHWHGATPTAAMSHIAIAESLDGKAVEWMEAVTDEQYLAGSAQTA